MGGGFEYRLEQHLLPEHGIEAQHVIWGAKLEGSATDLLGSEKQDAIGDATDRVSIQMMIMAEPIVNSKNRT